MDQSERGRLSGAARRTKRAWNEWVHAQEQTGKAQIVEDRKRAAYLEAMAAQEELATKLRANATADDWTRRG
jgi:hypothetical protein